MPVPSMSRPRRWAVGGVLVVVLVVVVTAILGGFRKVDAEPVTEVALGEEFEVGPFELSFHGAVSQIDPDAYVDEGEPLPRRLLVAVDVRVTAPVYVRDFVLAGIVRPTNDVGLVDVTDGDAPDPDVLGLADGVDVSVLNPGTTYHLVLSWGQEPEWDAADATVDLDVARMIWVAKDHFYLDDNRWIRSDDAARRLSIPVEVDDTIPEELREDR